MHSVLRPVTRRSAMRLGGAMALCTWLPKLSRARAPQASGSLPELTEIARTMAMLLDKLLPPAMVREFRDQHGNDGEIIRYDDHETAELGNFYMSYALDDHERYWSDFKNLILCYLEPTAQVFNRVLQREPYTATITFLRPSFQVPNGVSSAMFVYNGVCIRATEFVHDSRPAMLLDICAGVKGHAAQFET